MKFTGIALLITTMFAGVVHANSYVIHAGKLIDGISKRATENVSVVVADSKIEAIIMLKSYLVNLFLSSIIS